MQHALSTHLLVNHRLTTVWFDRIWDAGFPLVEIFCARQHLDYRDRAQIGELGHWFRDAELKVHSLHSPMHSDEASGRGGPDSIIDITHPVKMKRIQAVDEIKRALEIAETVPFRYLIQHLGVGGQEYDQHRIDAGFSALEELRLFAYQRGVELLLENTPNSLSSAEKLLIFFEVTHMDLNVCFDTGHANLHEGVEAEFRMLRDRIRSTHVHDNNGVEDLHLFPLVASGGTIDWRRTMTSLRSLNGDCPLLLELRDVPEMAHPLERARESLERLEELTSTNES